MIDPKAKEILQKSHYPEKIDNTQVAVDLISSTYLEELISSVFDLPDSPLYVYDLARLSLAASLIDSSNDNSFLVGESQYIINTKNHITPPYTVEDIATLTDIAVKYHSSNYDANAAVVAKNILTILKETDVRVSNVQKEYFLLFSKFLCGRLQIFTSFETTSNYCSPEENKLFSFLSQVMIALIIFFDTGENIDNKILETMKKLLPLSTRKEIPWVWSQEIKHVNTFLNLAKQKALIPRLKKINSLSKAYIAEVNNRFIWPSTEEFLEKYFNQESHNAVINTPTGSGKSFLAELASASALNDGWVLYLAPTNALCKQISTEFKKNLAPLIKEDISVVYGYDEYSNLRFINKKVFVTTPEKALIFLKLDPTAFESCSLVILDECHILDDKNRGSTAEIVLSFLMKISPDIRVILMSALVQNNNELTSWLTAATQKKTTSISSQWKPTRIGRFIVSLDDSTRQPYDKNGNYSENLAVHTDAESPWNNMSNFILKWTLPIQLNSQNKGRKMQFVNDAARVLSEKLVSKGKRTMLFVVRNRHDVFSLGNKWEKDPKETYNPSTYEKALINIAEFELGITSHVAHLINDKCVAVHSSSMLESENLLALSAYERRESNVRIFIATGTLSQGINLDFDAVVISGTDRHNSVINQNVEHEILNAMGRAARANYAIHGVSFIVPTKRVYKRFSKAELINRSTCIEKIDASTIIESDLSNSINSSLSTKDITSNDRKLLALFPSNPDAISSLLDKSWAMTSRLIFDDRLILEKLDRIQTNLLLNYKVPSWVLQSASIASMPPSDAVKLYRAINSVNLQPKLDDYSSFTMYLLDILAFDEFLLFEEIIKQHTSIFMGKEYDVDKKRKEVILSIKNTICLWINAIDYYQIGNENNQYKEIKTTEQWKRSWSQYKIPKVFKWIKKVAGNLSRYAGLLFSIKENWLENQPKSIPVWLANSRVIGTLSLGIKNGVNSPESLACYESIIRERKIAKILGESTQIELLEGDDIDNRNLYAIMVKNEFILKAKSGLFSDPILINLFYVINKDAQND